MNEDNDGNGDDFVTHAEFGGYVKSTNRALDKVNLALWGRE